MYTLGIWVGMMICALLLLFLIAELIAGDGDE